MEMWFYLLHVNKSEMEKNKAAQNYGNWVLKVIWHMQALQICIKFLLQIYGF